MTHLRLRGIAYLPVAWSRSSATSSVRCSRRCASQTTLRYPQIDLVRTSAHQMLVWVHGFSPNCGARIGCSRQCAGVIGWCGDQVRMLRFDIALRGLPRWSFGSSPLSSVPTAVDHESLFNPSNVWLLVGSWVSI